MGRRGRGSSIVLAIVGVGVAALGCWSTAAVARTPRIAFHMEGSPRGGLPTSDIFTVRPDGSGLTRVTEGLDALAPSWSPSRGRLVFAQSDTHFSYLTVVNADGSRRHTITSTAAGVGVINDPDWSARGRIAFEQQGAIFTIRPNGRGLRRVTRFADFDNPAWSPNGHRLAFSHGGDVWVMRANGRHKHRLIPDGTAPNWAPDRRHIAFQRGINVYVALTNGVNPHRLTGGDRAGLTPAWSPGGHAIAFAGSRGGIFTMSSEGEGARQIAARGLDPDW